MSVRGLAQRRLVVIGYQGFGNLGDEAILAGIEQLLAGSNMEVSVIIGGDRRPIAAFASAERLTSRRLLPGPSAIRHIMAADALLVAGGGLLHDHWRSVIPRYLAWVALARFLRRRVIWLGVGIGPIRRRLWRMMCRWCTRLSQLVLVRDQASARLLVEIGGRLDGVVPDPALFGGGPDGQQSERAHAPGYALGLIVRPPTPAGRQHAESLETALSALAAQVTVDGGGRTTVITFAGERDRDFGQRIVQRARQMGATDVTLEELPPDPAVGMDRLRQCEAVVSVRLHGAILAALLNIPFVGIAYDDKVQGVLDELAAGELVIPLADVSIERLTALLALARQKQIQEDVTRAVENVRGRRNEILRRVAEAVG